MLLLIDVVDDFDGDHDAAGSPETPASDSSISYESDFLLLKDGGEIVDSPPPPSPPTHPVIPADGSIIKSILECEDEARDELERMDDSSLLLSVTKLTV